MTKKYYFCIRSDDFVGKLFTKDGSLFISNGKDYTTNQLSSASLWEIDVNSFLLLTPLTKERRMYQFLYGGTLAYLQTLKSKDTFTLNNVKYTVKEIKVGAVECKSKEEPPPKFTIEDFSTFRPKSIDFNGNVNYSLVVDGNTIGKVKRDYYHEVYRSRMFELELSNSSEKVSLPFSFLLNRATKIDVCYKKIVMKAKSNFRSRRILSQSECKYYFALKTYDHHTNEKRIKAGDVIQNKGNKNFCEYPTGDKIKYSSKLLSSIFPISFIAAVLLSDHKRENRQKEFLSYRLWSLSQLEPGIDVKYKHSIESKKGVFVGFYVTEECMGIQALHNYAVDNVSFKDIISIQDTDNHLLIENGLLNFFLNQQGNITFDGFQFQNDHWSERHLKVATDDDVFYINFSILLNEDTNCDISNRAVTVPERLILDGDLPLVVNQAPVTKKAAHFSNDSQLKYEKYDSEFFFIQSGFLHFYIVFRQFKADDINVDKSCILASKYKYTPRVLTCLDFDLPLTDTHSYTDTHCLPIVNELEARLLLAISNFEKRLEVFCNYFVLHKISTSVLPFQVKYSLVESDQLYDGICKEFLQSSEGAVFLSVKNVVSECLTQFSADAIEIPNTENFRRSTTKNSFIGYKMDWDSVEFDGFPLYSTIRILKFKSTLEVKYFDLINKGYTWKTYEIFPPPTETVITHDKAEKMAEQSNTVFIGDFVATDCHIVIKQSKSASGDMFLPGQLLKVDHISCVNFDTGESDREYLTEISKHCFPLASEFQLRLLLGIRDLQKRLQFFSHGYILYRVCNLKKSDEVLYSIDGEIGNYLSEFVRFIKNPDEKAIEIELKIKENELLAPFTLDNIHFNCNETVSLNRFNDYDVKIIKADRTSFGMVVFDGFLKNNDGYSLSIEYRHTSDKDTYALAEILYEGFEINVIKETLTIILKSFKRWTDSGTQLKCILVLQVPESTTKCQRGSLLSTKTNLTSRFWQLLGINSQSFGLPDTAVALPLPYQWVLLLQTLDDCETRIDLALNGRLLQYICHLKEHDNVFFKNENACNANARFSQFVLEENSNNMFLQVHLMDKELNISCDKIVLPSTYYIEDVEFDKACSLLDYSVVKNKHYYSKIVFDGFLKECDSRVIKDSRGSIYCLTMFILAENYIDINNRYLVVNTPSLANDSSNLSNYTVDSSYTKDDSCKTTYSHEYTTFRDNSEQYSEAYAIISDAKDVIRTQPISESMNAGKKWHVGDLCSVNVPLQLDPSTYKNVSGVVKAIFYFGNVEMAGIELSGVFDDCETLNNSHFQGENRFSKDDKIENVIFVSTHMLSPETSGYDFKYNLIHIGEICYAKIVLTHTKFDVCAGELRCIFQHDSKTIFGIELKDDHDSSLVLRNSMYKGIKRFQMYREGAKRVVFLKSSNVSKNPDGFEVEIPAALVHHSSPKKSKRHKPWKLDDLCNVKVARISKPNEYLEVSGTVKAIFFCDGVKMIGVELFDEIADCLSYNHSRFQFMERFVKKDNLKNVVFLPAEEVFPMTSTPEINSNTSQKEVFSKTNLSFPFKDGDICNAKIPRISKPDECIEGSGTVRAVFEAGFAQIVGIELFDELDDCDAIEFPVFMEEKRFYKTDRRKNVVFVRVEDVSPITTATEIEDKRSSSKSTPVKFKSSHVKVGDICRAGIRNSKNPSLLVEVQGIVKCKFWHNFQNMIGIELFEEYIDCNSTFYTGVHDGIKRFDKDGLSKNALFTTEDLVACEISVETSTNSLNDNTHSLDFQQFNQIQPHSLHKKPPKTSEIVCGDPIPSLIYHSKYYGTFGIQGHHNSCYLDSLFFSMFSSSQDSFDNLIAHNDDDEKYVSQMKRLMRENIVNPLRKDHFVSADRVLEFRNFVESDLPGVSADEKDPEELFNFLFEKCETEPLIRIFDVMRNTYERVNTHQIISIKNDEAIPLLSNLLIQSFVMNNLRLVSVFDTKQLIVQIPRSGGMKMFKAVVPDSILDLSRICESCTKPCSICGEISSYECKQCYLFKEEDVFEDINVTYCDDCAKTVHDSRQNHVLRAISNRAIDESLKMELYAVLCIETSHYICFVKVKNANDEDQWIYFDSMADRVGEADGYNLPEVVPCDGISEMLEDLGSKNDSQREMLFKSIKDKAVQIKNRDKKFTYKYRFLKDAYICFYRPFWGSLNTVV